MRPSSDTVALLWGACSTNEGLLLRRPNSRLPPDELITPKEGPHLMILTSTGDLSEKGALSEFQFQNAFQRGSVLSEDAIVWMHELYAELGFSLRQGSGQGIISGGIPALDCPNEEQGSCKEVRTLDSSEQARRNWRVPEQLRCCFCKGLMQHHHSRIFACIPEYFHSSC